MPRPSKRRRHSSVAGEMAGKVHQTKRIRRESFMSTLKLRQSSLKKWKFGRMLTFGMLLLLFLQIINIQLRDGLSRYKAVDNIASISNVSSHRLKVKYDHFFRTGNIVVPQMTF